MFQTSKSSNKKSRHRGKSEQIHMYIQPNCVCRKPHDMSDTPNSQYRVLCIFLIKIHCIFNNN